MNRDMIAVALIAASACVLFAGHFCRTALRRRFRSAIGERYSEKKS